MLIIKSLVNAQNTEHVTNWIRSNYMAFNKDKEETFEYYHNQLESKIGSEIIITLIEHGFDPSSVLTNKESSLYQELFNKLRSYQEKTELKDEDTIMLGNLKSVETAIVNNQSYNDEWETYKKNHSVPEFPTEMLAKYQAQKADMEMKTKKLFEKYQIDMKYKDSFMKKIESLDRGGSRN